MVDHAHRNRPGLVGSWARPNDTISVSFEKFIDMSYGSSCDGPIMLTLEALPESCTAEEVVTLLPSLAVQLAIAGEPPSLRTIRLWRSRKMLSRVGRRLTCKNLLEALGIMRLRSDGLTAAAAAEKCMALSEDRLWLFLTVPPAAPAS